MKGSVATFTETELDIAEFDSTLLPDGSLPEPIVIGRYTRLRMEKLNHQDSLGSTTYEVSYRGIARTGPFPGQCLMLAINDDRQYRSYGFAVSENYYFYPIAVTQLGVFIHDFTKTYNPQRVNDYVNNYDFYPWSADVPFGDKTEVWTVRKIRSVTDGVATESYTITGSLHVGQTFTAGPITFSDGFLAREMAIGYPWELEADFVDYPQALEVMGARLILNDSVGATPTVTAFTVNPVAAFWNERLGYGVGAGLEVLSLTGNVAGPQVVNGYYASMWGTPNPVPLANVFSPTSPPLIEGIRNSQHNVPSGPGLFDVYGWVSTDGLKVSARATAQSYAIDIAVDGFSTTSVDTVGHHYTVGQTGITRGGVLTLLSPRPAQTVTWIVIPDADDIFEVVNGVLRFKAPATYPQGLYANPLNEWSIFLAAEAEDGYNTSIRVLLRPTV